MGGGITIVGRGVGGTRVAVKRGVRAGYAGTKIICPGRIFVVPRQFAAINSWVDRP